MYRYALYNRPACFGTVPRDINYTIQPRPDEGCDHYQRARHGILVSDRQLSDDECCDYELYAIVEPDSELELSLLNKVGKVVNEYASYWIEECKIDKGEFILVASSELGRNSVTSSFFDKLIANLTMTE